jgi:hypothetical protein
VYVYGTGLCAAGACGTNPQGQTRFTAATTTYPTATTWDYNNGSPMYNDITALAVGTGGNCNGSYCRTSEFSNCVDNTLPVSLLSFAAKEETDGSVILEWITSSEINNAYFIVERSTDGMIFEAIGKVNGKGNSSQVSSYTYTDINPGNGTVYYRLKQIDLDGAYGYSEIERIALNGDNLVNIYPNPNNGSFKIYALQNVKYSVTITDIIGQLVYQSELLGLENTINTSLSSGTYLIEVVSEGNRQINRLIVE